MSRSPLSPAGKRFKTMADPDDTDDEDSHPTSTGQVSSLSSQHEGERAALTSRRAIQFEWNPSSPSRELVRIVMERSIRKLRSDSSSDQAEELFEQEHGHDLGQVYQFNVHSQEDYAQDDGSDDDDEEYVFRDEERDMPNDLNEVYNDTDDEEYVLADHESEDDEIEVSSPSEYLKHDPTPNTQYPKPEWITLKELHRRKIGFTSTKSSKRTSMRWFEESANSSLWMIQRLRCTGRLAEHSGCVNGLGFSSTGNLLCSGSDDLSVCIWDWRSKSKRSLKKKIITGHYKNVFHSQFCNSDSNIVTSSRDGTVRLIDVETGQIELLLLQSGEISELAFITPQTLVTCGSNAYVNLIDLRTRETNTLFIVRTPEKDQSCALHTISSHPFDTKKIVVGGDSPYLFLYDLRITKWQSPCYFEYKKNSQSIITSTAFNSTGGNLLASFNDDDLVVYKTDGWDISHRFKGHRNMKTINRCAWFSDNFALSGSDDGHIYGWDLNSEHIVCFLKGDDKGVVNTLCVHPELPILASSGLDDDIKLWEPTSETWPQTLTGIKPQICKNTMLRKRALVRQGHLISVSESESGSESESSISLD